MNHETIRNWIMKAEHDLTIGLREMNADNPTTDMICFHMQQCAEKYLKAYLIFREMDIKKSHDLAAILKDCIAADASFTVLLEKKIQMLTPYGTVVRYPDDFYMPTVEETREAIDMTLAVKTFVRDKLKSIGFKFGNSET